MTWSTALSSLGDAVFGTFGVDGVYASAFGEPYPVRVIVDRNVEIVGDFGQVAEPSPVITLRKSEVETARRDDVVTVGDDVFRVVRVLYSTSG